MLSEIVPINLFPFKSIACRVDIVYNESGIDPPKKFSSNSTYVNWVSLPMASGISPPINILWSSDSPTKPERKNSSSGRTPTKLFAFNVSFVTVLLVSHSIPYHSHSCDESSHGLPSMHGPATSEDDARQLDHSKPFIEK